MKRNMFVEVSGRGFEGYQSSLGSSPSFCFFLAFALFFAGAFFLVAAFFLVTADFLALVASGSGVGVGVGVVSGLESAGESFGLSAGFGIGEGSACSAFLGVPVSSDSDFSCSSVWGFPSDSPDGLGSSLIAEAGGLVEGHERGMA